MVLLEAQACGLPILTFDIETGPAEIVTNGLDGYLIKPFDIAGMSEKLLELCTDADQRKNLGKQARESVRRFQPEEIYASWEQLFASLDIP